LANKNISMREKIILIGLNEINFSYVEEYIKLGYLPAFKKLFSNHGYKKTISENEYGKVKYSCCQLIYRFLGYKIKSRCLTAAFQIM